MQRGAPRDDSSEVCDTTLAIFGMFMKTIFFAIVSVAAASGAMSVKLESSVPSPQPVGSAIGFIPRVEISGPAMYTYRYSVSTAGGPFRIVRDFSQAADFTWSPELYEHEARIRV